MKKLTVICIFIGFCVDLCQGAYAKDFVLLSPDKKIKAVITGKSAVNYSLSYEGKTYLLPSDVSLTLKGGLVLGENARLIKSTYSFHNEKIKPAYGINKELRDCYNELVLDFEGNYKIAFRAYNEGFAYRFLTNLDKEIFVESEKSEFRFADNYSVYFHPALSEADYRIQKVADIIQPNYSSMPVLLKTPGAIDIIIHESDVLDYPCMSLSAGADRALIGHHAAYPESVVPGGHSNFNLLVKKRADFIAKTQGKRSFPWRMISFAANDAQLLNNQLVYLLASSSKFNDVSWIKPGKVAWDWWNSLNLYGVGFKTGFNTETYKYYIDFAARNGLEYINLDEGWSDQFDLLKVTDKLDMPALIHYAKEKKVGIILWCVWYTIDRQMITALDQFEKWGISGLKVDFMDRDDQIVVNFQERLLKEAAKRKMMVNYHGAYHPTGMERTYPNQINTEGVKGLEWNKFDAGGASPQTDVTIPFIRMFAGSMDYTPGAMQNFNKEDWKQIFDRPMSQGTRCHQLAMYTVYYAPLQMLADAPTAYEKEKDYMKYLAGIPTIWDETVPLKSEVGEYICIARRKGNDWYLGAMTNWSGRALKVKLDFLTAGEVYRTEIFMDGENADRIGSDYKRQERNVVKGEEILINMAPGGGWSGKFSLTHSPSARP